MKKANSTKSNRRSEVISRIQSAKRESTKRNITFRLEEELVDTFSKLCTQEGISMNEAVKHLIEDFVK